jgi:thiol-disulfide isomerase/thioredoxin
VKVGTEVPKSLALADINGKPVSFADLRGKTVVIHFWSVVCPAEPMAEPKVNKIADDYKDKGVVVLGINANQNEIGAQPTAEDWQGDDKPYGSFRKQAEQKLNHRLLLDHGGNVARTLQARTTPHCFVVSPKGVLVYSGALDANGRSEEGGEPYVRNAIDAVIAGKKVTVAETKPYG